jgi:hypothetical protein
MDGDAAAPALPFPLIMSQCASPSSSGMAVSDGGGSSQHTPGGTHASGRPAYARWSPRSDDGGGTPGGALGSALKRSRSDGAGAQRGRRRTLGRVLACAVR